MLHLTRDPARRDVMLEHLPETPATLRLREGDRLVLTADSPGGTPAVLGIGGEVLQPAMIGVIPFEGLRNVQIGDPIWLDDGSIGGVIRTVEPTRVEVAITYTRSGGGKLGADKGVNLPASTRGLAGLTAKDREDLRFVDRRIDLVGYSFVSSAEDVADLQAVLAEARTHTPGLVLKIETRAAFEQLPSLLIAAMRSPSSGVMIARGDLAVECGYERLAEVQEEILWMAEAAHTPVIWATQVLEHLAKEGVPSRAEITDAAMSERAECVMLNKGPFILETVRVLGDILGRMAAHQRKKSAMLRELALARRGLAADRAAATATRAPA
jgi:pyruvate kinase